MRGVKQSKYPTTVTLQLFSCPREYYIILYYIISNIALLDNPKADPHIVIITDRYPPGGRHGAASEVAKLGPLESVEKDREARRYE